MEKVVNGGLFADRQLTLVKPVGEPCGAVVSFARDCDSVSTLASTPALALVKACLLAVGVSQEEIDEAESAQ